MSYTQSYPPSNYTTLAKPALDTTFTDPVTGCAVKRMVANAGHEYSSPSAINQNDTLFLGGYWANGGTATIFRVGDGSVQCNNTQTHFTASAGTEPRWSVTEPNVLYYHSYNKIMRYDASTCTGTVYDTFDIAHGKNANYTAIDFCGGENDGPGSHRGGDYLCVRTATSGWSYGSNVHLYRLSTRTLYPLISGGGPIGKNIDYARVTPVNLDLLVVWGSSQGANEGQYLYNGTTGAFIRKVYKYDRHSDEGVDSDGSEIIVTNSPAVIAPCTKAGALVKIKIGTGAVTALHCQDYLLDEWFPSVDYHISLHNTNASYPAKFVMVDTVAYAPMENQNWTIDATAKTATFHSGTLGGDPQLGWWIQFHGFQNGNDSTAFTVAARQGNILTLLDPANKLVSGTTNVQWTMGPPTAYCDPTLKPLCSKWQSAWVPYANEVLKCRLDGSGCDRIAQHRSMMNGATAHYYSSPKGSVSRSGSYYLFDSNWGQSPNIYDTSLGNNGVDIFLTPLPR